MYKRQGFAFTALAPTAQATIAQINPIKPTKGIWHRPKIKNTIAIMPKINATISLLLINHPFNMPNGIFIIILYIN